MTTELVTEEVDDVVKTLMTQTPAGSSVRGPVTRERFAATSMAPTTAAHGTGLSSASAAAAAANTAQVVLMGARVIDLPGSPPRGAPV